MIQFLLRTFVKNHDDIKDSKVREQYGSLSSFVGIFCNVLLFAVKFTIGTMSNSLAITTDAFNNLSDSASSIITLFGYKQAAKPADRDHPFGHGRVEYLVSLVIAVIIMFVGFEFLKTSIDKIRNPQQVIFSTVALVSILISMGIKLWMYYFNQHLGHKINSSTMIATSKDSLSDVAATGVTLLSLIVSKFSDIPIDGWVGLLVSGFIMNAGYQIIRDTVDTLLGQGADQETVDSIIKIIESKDVVLGVHDLIVHNYGPGKMLASAHVEVSADCDIIHSHDQIDNIEREIYEQLGISIVIHMDPIEVNNETIRSLHDFVKDILKEVNETLSMHDFRVVVGETHTNLIFDVEVPFEIKETNEELKNKIDDKIKEHYPSYYTVITFDRSFL